MKPKSRNSNGDASSFWSWNKRRNKEKRFPVSEFLERTKRKAEETVVGPGGAAGIGCGVGLGFGLVGGLGYGGWPWNHLKLVFGIGFGCGIGIGFGYGQGIGYGYSFESLESSYVSNHSSNSNKRGFIEI
ncbi:hypothetical protein PanWU01x14_026600 [Parasponia andersonii]|uniref:Glycine-rich protein n=1 Tax=Parasponia andersonii TaxID=3476 RepID=A0A2P5DW66_PARAD|nr:hypothetical protein PanWU01x14_026600 [Parasponia andersonii]